MSPPRLTLSVSLIVSLLGAAASAGGTWAVNKSRTEETESQVRKLEKSDDKRRDQDTETALHMQRIDLTLEQVQRSLDRIEHRMGTK